MDLPEYALTRLEPWAAAMVLTQLALVKSGFDPQLGIDMQISARARSDGKPVDGLESVIDQLTIFDSRSLRRAEQIPGGRRRRRAEDARRSRSADQAWREGDLRALESEFRKERQQAPQLYDELLGARNRKWLPQIQALLGEQRNYLVVVGTLHFVGKDGLLELLKRSGHAPIALPGGNSSGAN